MLTLGVPDSPGVPKSLADLTVLAADAALVQLQDVLQHRALGGAAEDDPVGPREHVAVASVGIPNLGLRLEDRELAARRPGDPARIVAAVRERVDMTEISNYAKYRVTGPGAEAWLSSLLTARMPAPGRITLTAMLNDAGRIVGEFTVARSVIEQGGRVRGIR